MYRDVIAALSIVAARDGTANRVDGAVFKKASDYGAVLRKNQGPLALPARGPGAESLVAQWGTGAASSNGFHVTGGPAGPKGTVVTKGRRRQRECRSQRRRATGPAEGRGVAENTRGGAALGEGDGARLPPFDSIRQGTDGAARAPPESSGDCGDSGLSGNGRVSLLRRGTGIKRTGGRCPEHGAIRPGAPGRGQGCRRITFDTRGKRGHCTPPGTEG